MPCPDCATNHQRAERAEEAEKSLLLFAETIAKLTNTLAQIEAEFLRHRQEETPPPPE
jgi:hypothetical protein